jgi:O-succinylbenzoic acid--CoA ligase
VADGLRLLTAARQAPHADALLFEGRTYSYAALAPSVAAACGALLQSGLGPDTRVALSASNRFETFVTLAALLELGIPFVPLHPRLTAGERAVLLEDAAPALVLGDDELHALVHRAPPSRPLPPPARDPEHLLAMLYTSGTTGRPKGAMLSRRAFLAAAAASAQNLTWHPGDRWLLSMPLCHVGGLSILTRCLLARQCVVLESRFDPSAVLARIARDGVTLLSVVPTMLRALLEEDRANDLRRLRAMLVGGAACPFELLEECARRGIPALATYGLTEACSQVTVQRLHSPPVAERGSGIALPGTEVSIVDDAGAALPPGEVGRIRVRGSTLMTGYFGQPPLSGALETGDLGALDESGRLHVHSRRTDLIVTGGENVYPLEIEHALEACPGVRAALVFGVPDPTWGQLVAAAIVPDPARPVDEARLFELLSSRLASHKRPRRVCFVEALPMRPSGKTDRAGAVAQFSPQLRPWHRPG